VAKGKLPVERGDWRVKIEAKGAIESVIYGTGCNDSVAEGFELELLLKLELLELELEPELELKLESDK